MASIEEKVEEYYKSVLDKLGIRHYAKTESINPTIDEALKKAPSKSGKSGNNFPDIRIMLKDKYGRVVPVIIEAKGEKNKMEKLTKDNNIEGVTEYTSDSNKRAKSSNPTSPPHKKGDPNYSAIVGYAVNGALHYGKAILNTDYEEVIIIGVNGTTLDSNGIVSDPESKAYYISKKNNLVPKEIKQIKKDDWNLFKDDNISELYRILDNLNLTDKEIEELKKQTESSLESKIKEIHQEIYDNDLLKTALSTNEKLYLFSGLIMAGLKTKGVKTLEYSDFKCNDNEKNNDGELVLQHIRSFLDDKNCATNKIEMIIGLLSPVFKKKVLWKPKNGESFLKFLFKKVKADIIPFLESNLHLDFTGKILNSLNDWVNIENDKKNDVVLTPRYVTDLMARLARTNRDSYVWDMAMGSAGFLVSAMNLMIKDAYNNITDKTKLEEKIESIKTKQILGVEILGNIFILAILNMILMGDGSSNVVNDNSHNYINNIDFNTFTANVFLLNPPYSADGKGFIFVKEALEKMQNGYACILIQDSAGNGQGLPYTQRILENNTLKASIKMPSGLFGNKASVSVYIFLFEVNRPHEENDNVIFIDFTEDGYSRQNRKKSSQEVNLRNTDHAIERYDEIVSIVLNKKSTTNYYTESNGKVIKDTISLNGDDWLFTQHQKINTTPTEEDFKRTVANFLSWKVSNLMKGMV